MPRSASSDVRSCSTVSATGPNDEFSIGTTPYVAVEAETAVKTSEGETRSEFARVHCTCCKGKGGEAPAIRSCGTHSQSPKKSVAACSDNLRSVTLSWSDSVSRLAHLVRISAERTEEGDAR